MANRIRSRIIVSFGIACSMLTATGGCSRLSTPMRLTTGTNLATCAYIETNPRAGIPLYSCSFVEFDGRGDYVDVAQHTQAWETVRKLGEKHKVLLVFYCHGWKNNSQSGDVVEFNSFLRRLAASEFIRDLGCRVHGVYLSWRGNLYQPYVNRDSKFFAETRDDYGGEIVSKKYYRTSWWPLAIPETLSYWSRLNAAADKVSGIPMARTIYTCASLVKALDQQNRRLELTNSSRVIVIGHSFGALVLERALSLTCLDPLTKEWSWFDGTHKVSPVYAAAEKSANPLPLDFVLFVNSAAPAIYAKEMRDFLAAHRSALHVGGLGASNAPVFISLTSSADCATRNLHPIANMFAPLYPSLQRTYTNLILNGRPAHQSTFYTSTPGHQPLLIDHWIVPDSSARITLSRDEIFNRNLDFTPPDPTRFFTMSRDSEDKQGNPSTKGELVVPWGITDRNPVANEQHSQPEASAYWIIRCDKRLIRDHNDIWSNTAMELYAGLYRMVEVMRLSHQ